ncbi:DUF4097 family beta strand repeat-containing protein [Nocardioides nitrophenolicus]|uniref:DUF4097 family beta strand repeat-containing protein n=1 Tax=Nocardioides nitrophenolicus TaxID=60489 RepID=UPI001956835E|nr:DUF4097 family beta strand repeat-containing protein [Nocardioides nitrophenolicus]MBM7516833.1 DUF4097 and DUF4098 domain-containing protein YvlB [Nocardioides nitrophenolicus]
MTDHEPLRQVLETPGPVRLHVENGRGRIVVRAADQATTEVTLAGARAAEVRVTQDGRRIGVHAPKQRNGVFARADELDIEVVVPLDSDLIARSGSASITASGRLMTARVKSASGEVVLDQARTVVVDTGSGDVSVAEVDGDVRVRTGSGAVDLGRVAQAASVSTGSGDVCLGQALGTAIVKTGSGDLEVGESVADLTSKTGSGDVVVRTARRGRILIKGASTRVRVGIPAGTPVWTDVTTVTGRVSSTLPPVGRPEPGADHVELRATTVSGDISLVPA